MMFFGREQPKTKKVSIKSIFCSGASGVRVQFLIVDLEHK